MILQLLKKYWKWIAMIIMAIVIIYLTFTTCNRKYPEGTTSHTSDTLYDSIVHVDTIKKYYPVSVILPGDTFWKDVDTAVILQKCKEMYKDYFSKKAYSRLIIDNKDLFVKVNDTTYKNSLIHGGVEWKIRRPMIENSTTTIYGELPRNKLYLMSGFGWDTTWHVPFSVLMTTKGNWAFEIGTDVRRLLQKKYYFEAKAAWKIHFKRKK